MKPSVVMTIVVLIAVYTALLLLQLWFEIFSSATFIKISISFAALIAVITIIALIVKEYLTEKRQKDKGYID